MMASIKAALSYFTITFTVGFLLGAIRTILIIPATGDLTAVLLELPVMLAVCWIVCRYVLKYHAVPTSVWDRAVMGCFAFGLLMIGEFLITLLVFGQSLSDHLNHYHSDAALLGLIGQAAFALFPYLALRIDELDQNATDGPV